MSIFYVNLNLSNVDKFDCSKFFDFNKFVHDPLTSFFLEKIHELKVIGTRTISSEVNRPERLSYKLYGSVQYWWILLEYNKLIKFTDLKSGIDINYFSIDDLEDLYYSLKTEQVSNQISTSNLITENDTGSGITPVPPSDNTDLHRVYEINNLDYIVINHDMNKRPTPVFVVPDVDGNEVAEDIFFRYTAGLETKQIVIILHTPKTGKVILN